MAPSRFQRLVSAGLDQGLSRAEAERRARDDLFGDIMNPDSSSPRDDTPAVSAYVARSLIAAALIVVNAVLY